MAILNSLRCALTLGLMLTCFAASFDLARANQVWPTQAFLVRNWDQEDGLPSTVVRCMTQTRDGYLWLGTADGFARFDGVRFVGFRDPFKRRIPISAVLATENIMWIGTVSGQLVKKHGSLNSEIALPSNVSGKQISGICSDGDGNIWLATLGAGLIRLNEEGKVLAQNSEFPSSNVTQIISTLANQIWAVADGSVVVFTNGIWQTPPSLLALNGTVRVIAKSVDGDLWIVTALKSDDRDRLFKLRQGQLTEIGYYPWTQGSQRSRISALLEADGKLWCGTQGDGVYLWSPDEHWSRLSTSPALMEMDVNCLMAGEGKIVWIGSRTQGLYQAAPQLVRLLRMPPNSENIFTTVCAGRDGVIWGGTDGQGIFRWQGLTVTNFGAAQGLGNLRISALLEDVESNLWVATSKGLFVMKNGRFEAIQSDGIVNTPVYSLLEDHAGNIWTGTRKGLVCLHGENAEIYGQSQGLPIQPRALAEDSQGNIYAAGIRKGLFRLVHGGFEKYPTNNWPGYDSIRALHFDAAGDLWIATDAFGLSRLHNGVIRTWNYQDDGLPSGHGFAILETNEMLWVSSEHGIYGTTKAMLESYSPGTTALRSMVWWLNVDDGLAQKVCSGMGQPTAAIAPDGTFWFPNGVALAGFHPEQIAVCRQIHPPLVENPIVDDNHWLPDENGNLQSSSESRRFEFPFTSPNFFTPQRIRFRYKLAGVDRDWINDRGQRSATYSQLAPGKYQFEVMAAGPGGQWVPGANNLNFEILPRWWERRSLQAAIITGFVIAVAVVVGQVVRGRYRRRLERLQLQQAMAGERERIARDIHDDLGSGLTEIMLLSDTLSGEVNISDSVRGMLAEMSQRTRSVVRAMDEVVWAVNPHNDTLESFLSYLNRWVQSYLTRANVRCRWLVPIDIQDLPLRAESRHQLFLACKEAVNNIVKHAAAKQVTIRAELTETRFILSIEDDGSGMNPSSSRKGHGMDNLATRMKELSGLCKVESIPGSGTRVIFELPVSEILTPSS